MFRDETSFLPEQLHRQNVSGYHDDHGYVEGDQRAEHEKRSVVDHACSRPWHNIQRIYYAWGKRLLHNKLLNNKINLLDKGDEGIW